MLNVNVAGATLATVLQQLMRCSSHQRAGTPGLAGHILRTANNELPFRRHSQGCSLGRVGGRIRRSCHLRPGGIFIIVDSRVVCTHSFSISLDSRSLTRKNVVNATRQRDQIDVLQFG